MIFVYRPARRYLSVYLPCPSPENITVRSGDRFHQFGKIHFRMYRHKVFLHHVSISSVSTPPYPYGASATLLSCQTHRVDAMWFENNNRQIGTDRNDHQRKEQIVSSRQLGNQKYSRQRCMHDTTHHPCHAQQCEILSGKKAVISNHC